RPPLVGYFVVETVAFNVEFPHRFRTIHAIQLLLEIAELRKLGFALARRTAAAVAFNSDWHCYLRLVRRIQSGLASPPDSAEIAFTILRCRQEIAPTISKPPAVEEAKPIEAPEIPKVKPVEGVAIPATKLDDAVPPTVIEETVPPVADETVNVHDINIIDRFRPTRFVFDKMGLFDIWESAFKAETLKAEAQVAFNEELNKHAKAVGKDVARRKLVWEFVNNNDQAVFNQLTFEEKQAALWWKRTADDWADRLNISQERRIKDYIPHIFDEAASQAKDSPVDASISMLFSKKITDKVRMPFLRSVWAKN
ncbi:hypothetical protein LCGC14_2528460, partial [marine sediment metagenome]